MTDSQVNQLAQKLLRFEAPGLCVSLRAACAWVADLRGVQHRWEEIEWPALEAVQELHRLSESHPENQRIIGRNKLVLEGVVHVLQNGSPKSKLWCCAVLVNLAYRSEENTAKIGAHFGPSYFVCVASHPSSAPLGLLLAADYSNTCPVCSEAFGFRKV